MLHPSKILKSLGIPARKSFGQNFLVNTHTLETFIGEFQNDQPTLEIGPGLGAVTDFFLERGFKLYLSEKDKTLAAWLEQTYRGRLEVTCDDFLKVPESFWQERNITQVVGNLPFYITTPIFVRVTRDMPFVQTFVAGIQKDVAQKIVEPRGNSLSLFLHASGDLRYLADVKKSSFYPTPAVDGAWVLWRRNPKIDDIAAFEVFLRGAFWGKRKNLRNALGKNPFFREHEVSAGWGERVSLLEPALLDARPDQLDFEQIKGVFEKLSR